MHHDHSKIIQPCQAGVLAFAILQSPSVLRCSTICASSPMCTRLARTQIARYRQDLPRRDGVRRDNTGSLQCGCGPIGQ